MKNGTGNKPKQRASVVSEYIREYIKRDLIFFLLFSLASSFTLLKSFSIEHFIGGFFIATLIFAVYYKDILRYAPSYIREYKMIVLLGVIIFGTLLMDRVSYFLLVSLSKGLGHYSAEVSRYLVPTAAGAMLVSLLFDFHTAILFAFSTSLLSAIWLADATMAFYFFMGSLIASFSVIRCKRRSDILRGGIFVSAINVCSVFVILLFTGDLLSRKAVSSVIFAALDGVAVSAIVSIALPILESLFKRSTDISLLELLDLNQPLMRNLMITAPGTYHHSVIVGNLVEAAAEAVGVNPLLARVSAYYHDIGKVKMPEYFIENQAGSVSKHDKLSPHMSSMILVSHVKEGVELARQYKVPVAISNIIEQHHGTNLISYFYLKAKNELGENPAEEEYRYPGPKPQSRVAALVMMADAVEASSRVLKDPTPSRIEALVDKIINHIFLDGQLDNCELTLKDISLVKKHFTYILTGIFHRRIDYPGFDFSSDRTVSTPLQGGADDGYDKGPAEAYRSKPQDVKK